MRKSKGISGWFEKLRSSKEEAEKTKQELGAEIDEHFARPTALRTLDIHEASKMLCGAWGKQGAEEEGETMYDEKWMNGTEDKPIDTAEDAMVIIAASATCGGTKCRECIVHMYDHSDSHCGEVRRKALGFMANLSKKPYSKESLKTIDAVWEYLFRSKAEEHSAETPELDTKGRSCANCHYGQKEMGGARFCESWHNLTHYNGYCYRHLYDSKIEEEQKPQKDTQKCDHEEYIELPF